jgi:Outer membrane protein beta-barrel domain
MGISFHFFKYICIYKSKQSNTNLMKTAKLLIVGLVAVCISHYAQAQSGRLSIGFEAAQPSGDLADFVSTGFGGSLRYEFPMGDRLGLGLTAGYLTFGGEDDGPSWAMIPIQAFLKFYFGENQGGLYGQADVGVHNTSIDIEGSDGTTNFSYAPGVGFHMAKLDLGLRWQFISDEEATNSYLGLRIAYVFGSK